MRQTKEQRREDRIIHEMSSCVHFAGIQHAECAAGVNIRALVGGSDLGWAARLPCLLMDAKKCEVVCDVRKLPTREEAEAEVDRSEKQMERSLKIIWAAHEHAKQKGYGQGHGGKDSMPCPSECGGTLHYSVASLNGHMWGRCTTADCASWME